MARCKRTTHKNNIVILCEGSDTEVKYFCDLKSYVEELHPDSFSDIKILPVADEIIREKKGSRRKKTLRQPIPSLHSDKHYWCKWEHTDEEYELYKAQPTRYVRETQLYMEEDGYVEGWAVFDKDTFTDHQTAFKLAEEIEGLHIAFSSHCFEEWLLLHFERNPHLFSASVCKMMIKTGDAEQMYLGTATVLYAWVDIYARKDIYPIMPKAKNPYSLHIPCHIFLSVI